MKACGHTIRKHVENHQKTCREPSENMDRVSTKIAPKHFSKVTYFSDFPKFQKKKKKAK